MGKYSGIENGSGSLLQLKVCFVIFVVVVAVCLICLLWLMLLCSMTFGIVRWCCHSCVLLLIVMLFLLLLLLVGCCCYSITSVAVSSLLPKGSFNF